ncbi:hypothetical protein [Prevotella sp. AGR2160]|uniref:hypothetical protein n=1 Tax=Prevotella sp. AGR2160 TaxID=1280674 RepID=UPI0012DDE53A|nr:hypothetical protein [Prevotella sp. AGR2160]
MNLKQGKSPDLYDLISHSYDCQIRNSTAHSSYYINLDSKIIALLDSETYSYKEKINFDDWEKIFIHSVMLSYHLMSILNTRLNHFMDDYPNINTVSINWPSFIHPGRKSSIKIYPYRIGKIVRFNFETKFQPFLGKNDSK